MAEYSMANRKIAYTLGRGRAYIYDMSSTSGYMGAKYIQEFGHIFFDMSSICGSMGATYFQEFGLKIVGISQVFRHVPLPKRVTFTKGLDFCCQTGLRTWKSFRVVRTWAKKSVQYVVPSFFDMSSCPKGSHLQRRWWIFVVGRIFTGGL